MRLLPFPLPLPAAVLAAAIAVAAGQQPAPQSGFRKTVSLQGITFKITCANKGSLNRLIIEPSGLSGDNSAIQAEVDGTVLSAGAADLNADGSPEIYVFTQSAGSGSYGSVLAWAANRKKSLTPVTLPDLMEDKAASAGYAGHDEFAIVENCLVRRFKVPGSGGGSAGPAGRTRQISYRLKAGEAGWILRADKPVEF